MGILLSDGDVSLPHVFHVSRKYVTEHVLKLLFWLRYQVASLNLRYQKISIIKKLLFNVILC